MIFNIEPIDVLLGPGEVVSPVISADATTYVMHFQQVGWPHAGDKAFDYVCSIALDGQPWQPLMSGDILDLPLPARGTNPEGSGNILCRPIPGIGVEGRRFKFSWVCFKPLTISGRLIAK